MAHYVVGYRSTMPGPGKTAQTVVATRRLEDSLHTTMMPMVPYLCKMLGWRTECSTRVEFLECMIRDFCAMIFAQ